MTDLDMLLFGCVVTFVALAGVYVYARHRFVQKVPVRAQQESRAEAAAKRGVHGTA